ncbi:MAG TPA: ABC transporter ATP-binding protein [Anaerolineae bacterium]
MNIIETYDLAKSYGRNLALDQVNLAVAAGSILGVVGASGSGKTTLLRILATLVTPTAGDALIGGSSVSSSPSRIRRMIGYMPHHFGAYPAMTVEEYLRFFAESCAVPRNELKQLVSDLLALVDLSHQRNEPLNHLSHGMHQRLNLARALAHDPQILLMDEPISDADPRAHVEICELIKELRHMGKTVVITTPIIADIVNLCTDIAILDQGHVLLSGSYPVVYPRLYHHRIIVMKFFGSVNLALSILHTFNGIKELMVVTTGQAPSANTSLVEESVSQAVVTVLKEIHVTYDGSYQVASDLLHMLMRSGVQVVSFCERDDTAQTLLIKSDADAGLLQG